MSDLKDIVRDLLHEIKLLKCMCKVMTMAETKTVNGLNVDLSLCTNGLDADLNLYSGGRLKTERDHDGNLFFSNLPFHDDDGNSIYLWVYKDSEDEWPLAMEYKDNLYYPLNSDGEWQLADDLFLSKVK